MSTNVTNLIFTANMGGNRANTYVGRIGDIFYDVDGSTPLRLGDGVTPGGIPFGISSGSTTFNPQFRSNTGNTLAGTVSTGSYVKQGAIVHLRINVDFANTTDFGANSQYQFTLPFPTAHTVTIRGGTLHQTAGASIYHIAGITDTDYSNTTMNLYYSGSTTDLAWKYSTPVAATSNTSHFDLSGSYETTSTSVS
jgi:hypothetical protein